MTRDEEIVKALRPVFAREARRIGSELALARGRPDTVRALAHRLVGTAATVGEEPLASAAQALEAAAAEGRLGTLDAALDEALAAIAGATLDVAHVGDPVAPPTPRSHGPAVLAIEDDPATQLLLRRIVELVPGVELLAAASGEEGVRLARDRRVALVLLDVQLPDVPGDEVLRRLREPAGRPDVPVVVLSADSSLGEERAVALGATGVLAKPFDVERVRALVEAACLKVAG